VTVACYLWPASSARKRDGIRSWLSENVTGNEPVEWYVDHGRSAGECRPALTRLLAYVASGQVSTVVIWHLTDLLPRFREVVTTLESFCQKGVRLVVVAQGADLSPAAAKASAPLLHAILEAERGFRRERQRRGITAARKRGVFTGRKPGSTKETPGKAAKLRADGRTVREVANELGVSVRTVFRYLGMSKETKGSVASKGAKP
jgi:DNA invertase Pin-like site-specific DNA recombinase